MNFRSGLLILDHCACARLRRDANEMASSPRSRSCSPPLSPWKIKGYELDYAKTNKLNRLRNKKWDMYVDCFLKSSRFKISVTLNNNKGTESGYAIKSVRIIPNEHNASLSHWKIIKEIEIDYYPKLKKKMIQYYFKDNLSLNAHFCPWVAWFLFWPNSVSNWEFWELRTNYILISKTARLSIYRSWILIDHNTI